MYKKLKICFMGSPQFSVPSLKAILEAGHTKDNTMIPYYRE